MRAVQGADNEKKNKVSWWKFGKNSGASNLGVVQLEGTILIPKDLVAESRMWNHPYYRYHYLRVCVCVHIYV